MSIRCPSRQHLCVEHPFVRNSGAYWQQEQHGDWNFLYLRCHWSVVVFTYLVCCLNMSNILDRVRAPFSKTILQQSHLHFLLLLICRCLQIQHIIHQLASFGDLSEGLLPLTVVCILVGGLRVLLVLAEVAMAHSWSTVYRVEHDFCVLFARSFLSTCQQIPD